MKYILLFLIFLLLGEFVYSQNDSKLEIQFSSLEEYLESFVSEDTDLESLLDMIDFFVSNPIILANSNINQIAQIPTVSYFDAVFIHSMVAKNPKATIDEIAEILNLNNFQKYILSICTAPYEKIKRFDARIRERSFYQFETPIGYENGKYVGEKWNLYQRYQANYKTDFATIRAGGTINKNPGEKKFTEFASGYLLFDNTLPNVRIIAGDFAIRAGMGNVFGDAFRQSKGINVINPTVNFSNGILPYTSKMDYRLMRGVSMRLNFPLFAENRISSTVWHSNAPRSATVSKDSTFVSSIFVDGTYRTESEIAKKNAISEKNTGATLEFEGCNYNVGALLTYFDYDLEIRSNSGRVFSGKNGYMSSIFSSFYFDRITISSELSFDNHSNTGFKFGTAYKSRKMDIAFHFRSFDENFRSSYGTIFGEFSYPANELGTYFGLVWKPERRYKLSAYFDWFYTYANTYRVDTNVTGFEIFTQFDCSLNSNTSLYGRLNYKSKTAQKKEKNVITFYQRDKSNFRIVGEHIFSKTFRLKSQFDIVHINNDKIISNEVGFAAYLEGTVRITNWLRLQCRSTYFETDSYDSAIWQFEYFYPGYSLSPPLSLDGVRSFLALQISPYKKLDIHFRYINLYKHKVQSLGSVYERINTNQQNRIHCQLDWRF